MLDAFKYCERLVRENDKDRFLATLFAPATHRPALFSLYAFNIEIAQVPGRVNEPLAGEIRLQWWRDAVGGALPEQVAGNPVAAALVETAERYRLPLETVIGIIDAESGALYGPEASRNQPVQHGAASVFSLAVRILNDGVDPGLDDLINHAGTASARVNAGQSNAEIAADFNAVREQLARCPDAVLPAFLPLALVRARFDLMRRSDDASAELPQWRKQWILWRASKNLPAWI